MSMDSTDDFTVKVSDEYLDGTCSVSPSIAYVGFTTRAAFARYFDGGVHMSLDPLVGKKMDGAYLSPFTPFGRGKVRCVADRARGTISFSCLNYYDGDEDDAGMPVGVVLSGIDATLTLHAFTAMTAHVKVAFVDAKITHA